MNLYSSIEETKENNNKKFNDVKEQVNNFKYIFIFNIGFNYSKDFR